MMHVGNDELRRRAERIVAALEGGRCSLRVGGGRAQIGGGTLPRSALPSVTIEVSHPTRGAQALAAAAAVAAGAGDRLRRPRQPQARSPDDVSPPGRGVIRALLAVAAG